MNAKQFVDKSTNTDSADRTHNHYPKSDAQTLLDLAAMSTLMTTINEHIGPLRASLATMPVQ
jgi:prophage maintenance system killer protein